jgi:hypothetical protein
MIPRKVTIDLANKGRHQVSVCDSLGNLDECRFLWKQVIVGPRKVCLHDPHNWGFVRRVCDLGKAHAYERGGILVAGAKMFIQPVGVGDLEPMLEAPKVPEPLDVVNPRIPV